MISIVKNHGVSAYGVNEYIIDVEEELTQLNCAIGSIAYIRDSKVVKQKTAQNEWTIKNNASSSTGGGTSDEALTKAEILELLK